MKTLVTGCAGFIGARTSELFLEMGEELHVFVEGNIGDRSWLTGCWCGFCCRLTEDFYEKSTDNWNNGSGWLVAGRETPKIMDLLRRPCKLD